MIAEINYTCKKCSSIELSSWEIDNQDPKDWIFFCYCDKCGTEFAATCKNSIIKLVNR